jgi:hypothetical protein
MNKFIVTWGKRFITILLNHDPPIKITKKDTPITFALGGATYFKGEWDKDDLVIENVANHQKLRCCKQIPIIEIELTEDQKRMRGKFK